jgi:hypothetical protein
MESVVVLVIVVTLVAIDAIARLDERRQRRHAAANVTPERIVVDLSDRDGGPDHDR